MLHHFVLHYAPGPAWLPGRSVFEQPLKPHRTYMRQLYDQGTVLAGGPYTDHSGGLVILQRTTPEEAEQVIRADPAIISGVMTASATPWHRMFDDPSTSIRLAEF